MHSRPGSTALLPLLITHTRGPQKNKRFGSHIAPQNSMCCPAAPSPYIPDPPSSSSAILGGSSITPGSFPLGEAIVTLQSPQTQPKGAHSRPPWRLCPLSSYFLCSREVAKPQEAWHPRCPCASCCPGTMPWVSPLHPPCPPGRHQGDIQDTPAEPQCFVLGMLVWEASPLPQLSPQECWHRSCTPHPSLGCWEGTHSSTCQILLPSQGPQPATSPLVPSPPSITIQQILITTLQPPVLLFPGFAGPGSAELSSSGSKMPFKITGEWRPLRAPCPRLPPPPWHPPRGQQHPCAM